MKPGKIDPTPSEIKNQAYVTNSQQRGKKTNYDWYQKS